MPGIEADLDLGPIEIMAGVRAELSTLNQHNRQRQRARDIARTRVPSDARLWASGACPAGGANFVLSPGGPDPGYYWLVRRIVIGGLAFTTAAAGTAEIYVSGLSFGPGASTGPMVSALTLSDLVDEASTLPNIAFYSSHQVVVLPQENLSARVVGGTAAQFYVMSAQIQVFRTLANAEEFEA